MRKGDEGAGASPPTSKKLTFFLKLLTLSMTIFNKKLSSYSYTSCGIL